MTACLGIDVGLRNLSYCILQKTDEKFSITDWKLIDVLRLCGLDGSCDKLTSNEIHDIANYALPLLFPPDTIHRYNIAHVAIEQQPHGKYGNQKIILFSHLIYNFFRIQLLNQKVGDKLETVVFTGSAKKYEKKWLLDNGLPRPTTYAQRKETSVQLCNIFCKSLHVRTLSGHLTDKQDDLADAFLLAFIAWQNWN